MHYDHLFSGIPSDGPILLALCEFCAAHETQVLASLPWFAAEIAGGEGFAGMLRLVREGSGDRLHLSSDLHRARRRLGLEISLQTHERLLRGLGDTSLIDVPSAWGVFSALRRVAIVQALKNGRPHRQVAKRFGVTARALRKLESH